MPCRLVAPTHRCERKAQHRQGLRCRSRRYSGRRHPFRSSALRCGKRQTTSESVPMRDQPRAVLQVATEREWIEVSSSPHWESASRGVLTSNGHALKTQPETRADRHTLATLTSASGPECVTRTSRKTLPTGAECGANASAEDGSVGHTSDGYEGSARFKTQRSAFSMSSSTSGRGRSANEKTTSWCSTRLVDGAGLKRNGPFCTVFG
jgi:hypothetical protein